MGVDAAPSDVRCAWTEAVIRSIGMRHPGAHGLVFQGPARTALSSGRANKAADARFRRGGWQGAGQPKPNTQHPESRFNLRLPDPCRQLAAIDVTY